MNNRQVSSDVLGQKRQALFDMLNGNVTPAAQGFAQTGIQTNEQIDRTKGRIKSTKDAGFSSREIEKEIGEEVFDISSRIQQKAVQQPIYQQPQSQYQQPQYPQPQYQQPQYPQPQYQQPVNENYNMPQSGYGAQPAAPVSPDLIQNMLDGRHPRGPQQYAQPAPQQYAPQPNYGAPTGMLNEDTKRELANDIVERIKTSFLREEIMSVLMEDVFSTDRMNKILTENFERLLKGYLTKQAKAKAATPVKK